MDKLTNQQIIEKMYQDYASGNMTAVLSCFDKDVVWERPGSPFIPFAGTFRGIDEVTRMFAIQATTISIKSFLPQKICTKDDTVAVLGHDMVEVTSTGKPYSTDWAQVYTLKEGKIIQVKIYLDTKIVADAFLP